MTRLFKAFRRLWLFATCDHSNKCINLAFADSTELVFCRGCGRILHCTDEGSRRHNPHLKFPMLDYTHGERDNALKGICEHAVEACR